MSRIRSVVTPGSKLRAEEIRALWTLRTDVLRLKPSTDPEKDYATFSAFLGRAAQVLSFHDADGPCGVTAFHVERVATPDGRGGLVVFPEYAAFRPELRGTARAMRGFLRVLPKVLEPGDLLRTWYLLGAGYPASFLAVTRLCADVWLDGEDVPAFEQQLLRRFGAELGGKIEPDTRIVSMPTVPPPLRPVLTQTPAYARYVARNPRWADGFGLVVLARTQPRTFVLRMITQQLVRRLKGR